MQISIVITKGSAQKWNDMEWMKMAFDYYHNTSNKKGSMDSTVIGKAYLISTPEIFISITGFYSIY